MKKRTNQFFVDFDETVFVPGEGGRSRTQTIDVDLRGRGSMGQFMCKFERIWCRESG